MWVSPKLINFFEQNSDKSKDEQIKLLMERFNFKLSTAKQRYLDYQHSISGVNFKEIAFKFFKENPCVVQETESKKYAEQLGMPISTYTTYKSQYRVKEDCQKLNVLATDIKIQEHKYGEKYYKGRLRQKFTFDDSRL